VTLMRNESRSVRSARRCRVFAAASLLIALFVVPGLALAAGLGPVEGGALPGPLPVFPPDNWWNIDVSAAPVDPNSSSFISFIGAARTLHPDLGGTVSPGSAEIYGMPYAVVDGSQPRLIVDFVWYGDESDGVGVPFYPIPAEAITQPHWVEGGNPGNVDLRGSQDRHLLIIDRDNKYLYELYSVYYNAASQRWEAGSGAFWDMKTNNRRPLGWTSADAAGLAIFPGLIRYDEVYEPAVTEIQHAFRLTVRATKGYVYPASHSAGSTTGALPMGARLRLKAGKDVSGFTPEAQKIFRAMKRYGLIVADNGSDMYIGGTFDTRWDNGVLNPAFAALSAGDFEVVQLGWNPTPGDGVASLASLTVNPSSVTGGETAMGTVSLSGPAPSSGATVTLSSANSAVVHVSPSVSIGGGATSTSFSIATSAVTASTLVGVTASYGGSSKTAALTAMPSTSTPPPPPPSAPSLVSLSLRPSTVMAGGNSTGTVKLSAPAPVGGTVVAVSSGQSARATVPGTVTVSPGKLSAGFIVSTTTSATKASVAITATLGAVTKTATLVIKRSQ